MVIIVKDLFPVAVSIGLSLLMTSAQGSSFTFVSLPLPPLLLCDVINDVYCFPAFHLLFKVPLLAFLF